MRARILLLVSSLVPLIVLMLSLRFGVPLEFVNRTPWIVLLLLSMCAATMVVGPQVALRAWWARCLWLLFTLCALPVAVTGVSASQKYRTNWLPQACYGIAIESAIQGRRESAEHGARVEISEDALEEIGKADPLRKHIEAHGVGQFVARHKGHAFLIHLLPGDACRIQMLREGP